MKNAKILIIIPAYNEEKNIGRVIASMKGYAVDFLVINDGSTDNTANTCSLNHIPCINGILNLGIGGAVQTGYKYAKLKNYDIAIQFDGDGQHNIDDLEKLLQPILYDQADMCIGSRFICQDTTGFKSTFSRRIGISIISKLIFLITKKHITDPTSGYRAVNKKVISLFAESYPREYPEPESITFLLKKGYRIQEVPVIMNERLEGKSSIHSWKNIYYMMNVCLNILLSVFIKKDGDFYD